MNRPTEVLIVGAGKRVQNAAVPAFHRAPELYQIRHLVGREEREETFDGRAYPVRALKSLTASDLEGIGLVFVCVSKESIPSVLERLASLAPLHTALLIDTPVLRFKHLRHARHLSAFQSVSVAEDCSTLPWLDVVRAAIAAGDIGELKSVFFDQSAWAYHGVALAKTILGSTQVRSGRRRKHGGEFASRRLVIGGKEALFMEPRDYATGRLSIVGSKGVISDFGLQAEGALRLESIVEAGACRGFRLGSHEVLLDEAEASLMQNVPEGASATALMEAAKPVGFLRLLRALHAGERGYPLTEGLDDMIIDYHLEKFGRYAANPLTSSRSPLAKILMGI
ncbi:hypothetical protein Poly30_56840 [Planctomycetes bacterium Poly30]|uniref:Gfo/Idh/MocA-like oxidoreductase N-terminal domain-containing protein n=1 Tax=Saltatorellus ferox TaxID=2528018 RepID=A0A518F1A1_9BACT|nr:hypothetical protein Poly30_56840 [Planctomycetes bacterium Poly30]